MELEKQIEAIIAGLHAQDMPSRVIAERIIYLLKEQNKIPETTQADVALNDLLCALKKYTAKNGRPYLRVAFFDDGSCEILDGDDILVNFDDTTELMEMLGT